MTVVLERARRANLGRARSAGLVIIVGLIVLFLFGPLVVALAMSFSRAPVLVFPPHGLTFNWYSVVLSSSAWTSPALTSVSAACLVALLSTVVGVMASYSLARGQFPLKSLFGGILILPLITPVIILALGQDLALTQWGLTDSLIGLVLAQSVGALPFVVINCTLSLRSLDRNLELAAAGLGASPVRVFMRVTFPLMRRGIFAGAIFAFLSSWDDATIATYLVGPHLMTLPVYLLQQVEDYVSPEIAAVGGYLTLFGIFLATLIVITGVRRPAGTRAVRRVPVNAGYLSDG
jgi:putative spermidine/putrescine transport system permease protein